MFCRRCGTRAPDEASHCPLCGLSLHGDGTTVLPHAVAAHGAIAQAAPALQYGGFWRRLVAVLIDSLVLWFPSATLRIFLGIDPFAPFESQDASAWTGAGVEFLIGWLYAALLISSPGRGTLGLQVMDLHVTDLQGQRITFLRATWRYLAQILTLFTLGFGYLLQLATPRRQTLHDLVSGTVVVRGTHEPAPMHGALPRMAP